jgi:hypothetical protein
MRKSASTASFGHKSVITSSDSWLRVKFNPCSHSITFAVSNPANDDGDPGSRMGFNCSGASLSIKGRAGNEISHAA